MTLNAPVRPAAIRRRPFVVASPYLLGAAAFLTVFLGCRDRLPDPVATHFTGAGRADGFTALGVFPYAALGLLLVPAALFAWFAWAEDGRRVNGRALVAVAYGVAGFGGFLLTDLVVANARAASAEQARLGPWQLAAALVAAAVAAALGLLLAGRSAPTVSGSPADPGSAPRLPLREGESVTWTRTVGSRALFACGPALLALGVLVALVADWGSALTLLVPGALLPVMSGARITVDRHGLTATAPWLPRPRLRVPLARIEEATARDISALKDMGGWGYRVHPGRSGLVLRSGEAIVARLTTGSEFVITVDDAATAAALLNALVARDRAHHGG
ncbi:hypothetical protein WEB32_26080 [Streptomyces netropsis]|uniref:hypothetical protein n=1 Tax=Streptomyces netropsis TaxID=55404 RepID=UPI0030D3B1A5